MKIPCTHGAPFSSLLSHNGNCLPRQDMLLLLGLEVEGMDQAAAYCTGRSKPSCAHETANACVREHSTFPRQLSLPHTCQPSRSRRDSSDLETKTRRPARQPKKADSSRSTPKNTILNLPLACSLCSSVGIQVSSVSFGLFSGTRPSVAGSYPNKKSVYIRALFWLKSSFSCHFPLYARNFAYILGLFFLAVN